MNKIAQDRKVLLDALEDLRKAALLGYEELTTPEKIVFILTEDHSFLNSDAYFSGSDVGHRDVSLYDDFYWERYETNYTIDLLSNYMDNFPGWDQRAPVEQSFRPFAEWLVEQDNPKAATLVYLVEQGVKEATHDW